jgi:hypothetical protein
MKRVTDAATFALFGGSGEGASGDMGALEGGPHGGVHLWVTNPTNFVPPQVNMGVLGTAALDPVFFAHHCNIDRLWSAWLETAATPPHANPPNDPNAPGQAGANWWLQSFVFYDQRKQWTQIGVAQVVDTEASLRFRYQPPTPPSPPGGGATPVAAAPAAGVAAAPAGPGASSPMAAEASSARVVLTPDPRTVSVGAVPAPAAAPMAAASARPRVILRIEGVEVPQDRGAVVKVFLNNPGATAATPASDPGFVGTIVLVPSTVSVGAHAHRTGTDRNFVFDVTDKVGGTLPATADVTLVPTTGTGTRPNDISLRFRRARLTAE